MPGLGKSTRWRWEPAATTGTPTILSSIPLIHPPNHPPTHPLVPYPKPPFASHLSSHPVLLGLYLCSPHEQKIWMQRLFTMKAVGCLGKVFSLLHPDFWHGCFKSLWNRNFIICFHSRHIAHAELRQYQICFLKFSQQSQREGVYDIYMKRDVFSH